MNGTFYSSMHKMVRGCLSAAFLMLASLPGLALADNGLHSQSFVLDDDSFSSNYLLLTPNTDAAPVISNLGPTVSSLGPTSATIVWQTDKESDSQVSYGTSSSYGQKVGASAYVAQHTVTLNGLLPLTQYHYQVSSSDRLGTQGVSGDYSFTTPSPGRFTDVSVTEITYETALVSALSSGLSSLTLDYGTDPAAAAIQELKISDLSKQNVFALSGLKPGSKYYLSLVGYDKAGNAYPFKGMTFTTVPLPAILASSLSALSDSELMLKVVTNTKTSLEIKYQSALDAEPQTASDAVRQTDHLVKLSKLFGATEYGLSLIATDEGGRQATEDDLKASTLHDTRPPEMTTPVVSINKAGDRFMVTARWEGDKPIKGQLSVQSKTNAKDRVVIPETGKYTTTQLMIANGLQPKTPYVLTATSTDNAGNQSEKKISFVTPSVQKSILDLILQNLGKVIDPLSKLVKSL